MTINALTVFPSSQNPTTFAPDMDTFISELELFQQQLNEQGNAVALGTASTSTSSITLAVTTISLTVEPGKGYAPGMDVVVASTTLPTNRMLGTVNTYDGVTGAMTVIVYSKTGTGTFAAWSITMTSAVDAAAFVTPAGVQTLSNKTLDAPVITGNGTAVTQSGADNSTRLATTAFVQTAVSTKANSASPTFTGVPAAPTASGGTNTTQIATTAFVQTAVSTKADSASPTFTGVPAAPTASGGTNTTQIATTAFVQTAVSTKANSASPTFTGVPAAPTAAVDTNTTQIATTAFVQTQIAATVPPAGRRSFTATGAITAGQSVAINTDGTVSIVQASYTPGTPGTKVTMSAVASQTIHKVVAVPGTNKMLVFYGTNSVVVAEIDPLTDTVMFGAPVSGAWVNGTSVSCAYHPVAGVFVIAYFNVQNVLATLSVSGTGITISSTSVLNGWTTTAPTAIAYCTVQNRMVAVANTSATAASAYAVQLTGTAITTVGTGVTLGTATTAANVQDIVQNPGTSVMVVLWRNQGTSVQNANAITVNANVVTVTAAVSVCTAASLYGSLVYHANQTKFVAVNGQQSVASKYAVFTLTGTTITLNTAAAGVTLPGVGGTATLSSGATLVYDPVTYKVAYTGYDNTTNYQALAVTASLSGSTLTADTPVVMNASTSSSTVVGYNSTAGRALYLMIDGGVSNYETARVWQLATLTTNADNFVGIAEASIANAASGLVTTSGGTNSLQSGLVVGRDYYVDSSGSLTLDAASGRLAGTSLSSTELLVVDSFQPAGENLVPDNTDYAGYLLSTDGVAPQFVSPPAGRVKFTASGAISAGEVVSLNSDGTISAVADLVSAGAIGSKSAFNAVNPSTIMQVVNVLGTDKVVILYNENGAIKLVAGTMVGGATNTYTIGTPIAAPTNTAITSFWITWNVTEQKIVMTYINTTMYAVTISLAGTVLTLGTPNNSAITPTGGYTNCEYNTVQNKTLVSYLVNGSATISSLSLTITGATFSWGTPIAVQVAGTTAFRVLSSVQIAGTSVIALGVYSTGTYGWINLVSINASVCTLVQSYTAAAPLAYGNTGLYLGYHQASGRLVAAGLLGGFITAATTGGSLTDIQSASITGILKATDFTYDPVKNYLVAIGVDSNNYAVSANLSFLGSSLVTSNTTTINTTASATVCGAYNNATDRVCIAFQDQGNLNYATSRVWQTGTSTANQWVGIAQSSLASGASGWVWVKGGVCDALSGLVINTNYYIDDSGSLQTTGTRLAGTAIATNRLLLTGNA
jgi:hypothetical protein